MRAIVLLAIVALAFAGLGNASSFETGMYNVSLSLMREYKGQNFFGQFDFFTDYDPTHGYTNFIGSAEAFASGLASANNDAVYIGSDHDNIASGRGRNSIRLQSKDTYNKGLIIADFAHMPSGCGTWPAFWTVGPNWPNSGEIDIVEGCNSQTAVQTTLHTSAGCSMASEDTSSFTGKWGTGSNGQPAFNCDVNAAGQWSNQGCGILGAEGSYGEPFNERGGGVYATWWDPEGQLSGKPGISTWFFGAGNVPQDITDGNPQPWTWGKPYAHFDLTASNCPSSHFANHQIVFDLTFCGDWAGSTFTSQCPGLGDCVSYVQNNPAKFVEAYWVVRYVRVFA